jgi:cell division protein YceG involved in septum cleavage
MTEIMKRLVNAGWEFWTHRNDILHDKENETTHMKLMEDIEQIQKKYATLPPINRITKLMENYNPEGSLVQKQYWYQASASAINRHIKLTKRRQQPLRRQQQNLKQWLDSAKTKTTQGGQPPAERRQGGGSAAFRSPAPNTQGGGRAPPPLSDQ